MSVMIPTKKLIKLANPFGVPGVWGCEVTRHQVRFALETGLIEPNYGTVNHAARIAYFVLHESKDPIEIDVGVPSLGYWPDWIIGDGNHRTAAAIYARRPFIKAYVAGELDYAQKLFGIDCSDNESDEEKEGHL